MKNGVPSSKRSRWCSAGSIRTRPWSALGRARSRPLVITPPVGAARTSYRYSPTSEGAKRNRHLPSDGKPKTRVMRPEADVKSMNGSSDPRTLPGDRSISNFVYRGTAGVAALADTSRPALVATPETRQPLAVKKSAAAPHNMQRRREIALLGFQLLRAAGFAVLLDLGLGEVLVLGADHPEDGRRRVLATGNGAELLGPLLPLLAADDGDCGAGGLWGPASAAGADAEGAFDGVARAVEGLALHQRAQFVGEVLDQGANCHGRG